MFQDPEISESISISGKSYVFLQAPDAPDVVYAELGKKAKVYRVMQGNKAYALKVFKKAYVNPRIVVNAERVKSLIKVPGLAVADRTVLVPEKNAGLIQDHPEFSYSVLMPWIDGKSWSYYVSARKTLTSDECLTLAGALVNIVCGLEERKIAHCDLSGGNFIFSKDYRHIELIDIEEIYSADLIPPDPLPRGTSGYSPDWIKADGLWEEGADRFAIGILVSEILAWQFAEIRNASSGDDAYFAEGEYGHNSKRYKLLLKYLESLQPELPILLDKAWCAKKTDECPPVSEWKRVVCQIPVTAETVNWGWESLDLPEGIVLGEDKVDLRPVKIVMPDENKSLQNVADDKNDLEKQVNSCPGCGREIQPNWIICPHCQFKFIQSENPTHATLVHESLFPEPESDVVAKSWPDKGGKGSPKNRMLINIFLVFLGLGVIVLALILMLGDFIHEISQYISDSMGVIPNYAISNAFLSLLVGSLYAWVFRHNIKHSRVWFFIAVATIGGLIAGSVKGAILQSGEWQEPLTIGALTGLIAGIFSSLVQNITMKSKGLRVKWFLYTTITWLVIWSIGTLINFEVNTVLGLALNTIFTLVTCGGSLVWFLKRHPDIEF